MDRKRRAVIELVARQRQGCLPRPLREFPILAARDWLVKDDRTDLGQGDLVLQSEDGERFLVLTVAALNPASGSTARASRTKARKKVKERLERYMAGWAERVPGKIVMGMTLLVDWKTPVQWIWGPQVLYEHGFHGYHQMPGLLERGGRYAGSPSPMRQIEGGPLMLPDDPMGPLLHEDLFEDEAGMAIVPMSAASGRRPVLPSRGREGYDVYHDSLHPQMPMPMPPMDGSRSRYPVPTWQQQRDVYDEYLPGMEGMYNAMPMGGPMQPPGFVPDHIYDPAAYREDRPPPHMLMNGSGHYPLPLMERDTYYGGKPHNNRMDFPPEQHLYEGYYGNYGIPGTEISPSRVDPYDDRHDHPRSKMTVTVAEGPRRHDSSPRERERYDDYYGGSRSRQSPPNKPIAKVRPSSGPIASRDHYDDYRDGGRSKSTNPPTRLRDHSPLSAKRRDYYAEDYDSKKRPRTADTGDRYRERERDRDRDRGKDRHGAGQSGLQNRDRDRDYTRDRDRVGDRDSYYNRHDRGHSRSSAEIKNSHRNQRSPSRDYREGPSSTKPVKSSRSRQNSYTRERDYGRQGHRMQSPPRARREEPSVAAAREQRHNDFYIDPRPDSTTRHDQRPSSSTTRERAASRYDNVSESARDRAMRVLEDAHLMFTAGNTQHSQPSKSSQSSSSSSNGLEEHRQTATRRSPPIHPDRLKRSQEDEPPMQVIPNPQITLVGVNQPGTISQTNTPAETPSTPVSQPMESKSGSGSESDDDDDDSTAVKEEPMDESLLPIKMEPLYLISQ
ncbi:hypothetical protein DFS34DRAFT_629688 [Phlyctochytrium arcticum]|nr:hypothetical protein DFS34DRAFT_629688 [Phlyctochytrium arcticum]